MLSHVDSANRPTMVDVGDKAVTTRTATARAVVVFPADVVMRSGEALRTKKGPVFDTAIIAGVMAAKRTHELIPFCHPIALEDCKIAIEWGEANEVVIECSVRATHKTGVEMEALTGATVAALTIYDMCKALTHGIAIREVALLAKAGGKRDYRSPEGATANDRGHGTLFRRVPRARGARHRARAHASAHGRRSLRRACAPPRFRRLDRRAAKSRSTTSSPIGTSH